MTGANQPAVLDGESALYEQLVALSQTIQMPSGQSISMLNVSWSQHIFLFGMKLPASKPVEFDGFREHTRPNGLISFAQSPSMRFVLSRDPVEQSKANWQRGD
jgi:hypothetical protein